MLGCSDMICAIFDWMRGSARSFCRLTSRLISSRAMWSSGLKKLEGGSMGCGGIILGAMKSSVCIGMPGGRDMGGAIPGGIMPGGIIPAYIGFIVIAIGGITGGCGKTGGFACFFSRSSLSF